MPNFSFPDPGARLQQGLNLFAQQQERLAQQKREDEFRRERLDLSAFSQGLRRTPEGEVGDVQIGEHQFTQIPQAPDPMTDLKKRKLQVDIEHTIAQTKKLGQKVKKTDPAVRQILMDYIKQTEDGVVDDPQTASSIKTLLQEVGAPLDVVEEVDLPTFTKIRNWLSFLPGVSKSKKLPRKTGTFIIKPKKSTKIEEIDVNQLNTKEQFDSVIQSLDKKRK